VLGRGLGTRLAVIALLVGSVACGRVRSADFPISALLAPTPSTPSLRVTRIATVTPSGVTTGTNWTEVLTLSNPDAPGTPIVVTGIVDNPTADGAQVALVDCAGVPIGGTQTCRATVRYNPVGTGSLNANPSFTYEYTSEGATRTGSQSFNVQMNWIAPSASPTPALTYNLRPLLLTSGGFPHSMVPAYQYEEPYGSITLQFLPQNAALVPDGVVVDPSNGKVSGTYSGASTSFPVCLVMDGVVTGICSNALIQGVTEQQITADITPCTAAGVTGDGSSSNPYRISTVNQFDTCVRQSPSKSFILTASLDFSSVSMDPIPTFSGTFDGQNFELSNYAYTEGTGLPGLGLFRKLDAGAIVKNLHLKNFNIIGPGKYYAGVFAGMSENSLLHNISISNSTVQAAYGFGALVGFYTATSAGPYAGGAIDRIEVNNVVLHDNDSDWAVAGGAIGIVSPFTQIKCSRIRVTGLQTNNMGNVVGGVIGTSWVGLDASMPNRPLASLWLDGATSSGTYSSDGEFISGIIGFASGGDVMTSIGSTAQLSSTNPSGAIGGLIGAIGFNVGLASQRVVLGNSYFAGSMSGSSRVGAIIGDTTYRMWNGQVSMTGVFRHTDLLEPHQIAGNPSSITGVPPIPITTGLLQTPSTLVFWNHPWTLTPGLYPYLW
jgi:hypothetical protein